jgi:hypothetical protein
MFGFDGPTALLLLLAGLAAVAILSMRRLGRFRVGDAAEEGPSEGGDPEGDAGAWRGGPGRPRLADPLSLLVGGLVILGAVMASLVILGLWP